MRVSSPASAGCSSTSTNSAAATVTVCQPPVISQQPLPNKMTKGTQSTVSVVASGDGLHYQWYEGVAGDVSKPVGFDQASFSFYANATTRFWVRITGTCGSVDSVAALQSVAPQITQQPVPYTGCGSTHQYSVTASGVETYTWYRETGGVKQAVGSAANASIEVTAVPTKIWVELTSGEAVVPSTLITVSTLRPNPTVLSFTSSQSSATTYIITAQVATAEKPYVFYKFYEGALGNTSKLLADASWSYKQVTVTTKPMKFWVRVYFTDTQCYTDRELTIQ